MKKSIKIISIIAIVIMILLLARPVLGIDVNSTINDVKATTPNDTSDITSRVNNILGFIQWAAIIGGVIIIAILGVKYMMGSVEEKAGYQKSFVPLIVGIVVVMGAVTIAKLLFSTFA